MKKLLLSMVALATMSAGVNAQRMTLHEEFTGENCGPCASTNPGFWSLCNGTSNPSKMIHISYMVPIPSAGWYCNRTTALYTWRDTYYSVPFAPYGRYDGHVPDPTCGSPAGSSAGHPGCLTQADIDAEALVPDSFTMSVTNAWNATFDSVTAVVTITSTANWTGTTPYLRVALCETNDFVSSPGSNGETHFENVVQQMYPSSGAFGTLLPTSWPMGTTHTYTITGAVPSYVDKAGSPRIVVFLQDDANKVISQAAQASPLPGIATDISSTTTTVAATSGFVCAGGSYSGTHNVTIKNPGVTNTLTSATIYYSVDGGAYTSYAWTGSLAPGATTTVTMPSITITSPAVVGSYHTIKDSVAMPNGSADINPANNVSGTSFYIESTTAMPMPYTTSFEHYYVTTGDSLYYFTDHLHDGTIWGIWQTGTTGVYLGHSGTYAPGFPLINYPAGSQNSIVLPEVNIPTPASTSITFWVAYSQQTTANTDKLELVSSTDCGGTWTPLWSMTGASMVTLPASSTAYSYPTSPSQYKNYNVKLSALSSGNALLAFRATDGGGNFLFLDDVSIYSSVDVKQVAATSSEMKIFPNPAKTEATLSFSTSGESNVSVQIVDELGRVMSTVANEQMNAGDHNITINTSAFANGVYNVVVRTEGGINTTHLSVAN